MKKQSENSERETLDRTISPSFPEIFNKSMPFKKNRERLYEILKDLRDITTCDVWTVTGSCFRQPNCNIRGAAGEI